MQKALLSLILISSSFLSSCLIEEEPFLRLGTTCINHRGGDKRFVLENSVEAIQWSISHSAEGVEIDINHTSDGVPVVYHDKILKSHMISKPEKECPVGKEIEHLSFRSIRDNCLLENGEELPTLEEIFEVTYATPLMILLDIKDAASNAIADLIQKHYSDRTDRLVAAVYYAENLKTLYTMKSRLPIPLLLAGDSYVPGSENGFHGLEMRQISDIEINLLKQKGKLISLYDVNDLNRMKELFEKKVQYITTDRPDLCLEIKGL